MIRNANATHRRSPHLRFRAPHRGSPNGDRRRRGQRSASCWYADRRCSWATLDPELDNRRPSRDGGLVSGPAISPRYDGNVPDHRRSAQGCDHPRRPRMCRPRRSRRLLVTPSDRDPKPRVWAAPDAVMGEEVCAFVIAARRRRSRASPICAPISSKHGLAPPSSFHLASKWRAELPPPPRGGKVQKAPLRDEIPAAIAASS